MKEVCAAFNISKQHCRRYVQFGNTFNLLHAAASFISAHQKSVGVAGVSDKVSPKFCAWSRTVLKRSSTESAVGRDIRLCGP